MLLIAVPFFIPVSKTHLMDFGSLFSMPAGDSLGMILMGFLEVAANFDIWQLVFSAKDDRTARWGAPLSAVFVSLATLGLVFIGLAARDLLPGADPNTLFYEIFTLSSISPYVLAGILVVLFAMGMSSLDTQAYVFSTALLRDFIKVKTDNAAERQKYIQLSRWAMALMLAVITGVALMAENVMQLLMGVLSLYSLPAPLFLAAVFGLTGQSKFADKMLFGAVGCAVLVYLYMMAAGLFANGFLYAATPLIISYGLSAVALVIIWCLKKRRAMAAA